MITRIINLLLLCVTCISAFAVEDLRGTLYMVYPADVTFYGRVHDVNNNTLIGFLVQVCWDDPTFTNNCDQPVTADQTDLPYDTCSGASCNGFHYPIPTSAVGSVLPRDGNQHLMYVKVISKANPGPGDKPIDGSPWPFIFKSGVVGPMWTANLEATPTRLTASQLAILVNSQDPYGVGSTGNVVCTVKGVAIKDDGVAGYYAKRHNVPCANIAVISVPVVQTTTQALFFSSILPAVQALPASIQTIAIAWVQPSVVGYNIGYRPQSISAAVANAGLVTGTGCVGGAPGLGYGPINPYFNSSSQAPYTDHHLRPTMMLAGEICPACTPTNNFSAQWYADFPTAKAFIDSAIAGTDTNPSGGNIYWTIMGDLTRDQSSLLVSPLELGNGLTPYAYSQVLGTFPQPHSRTVSAKNILLYEESAPNWNYASPTFIPGAAIGYSVTSSSGWLPSDGNQTTAASWMSLGAVGAFGNGVEPCELLTYKSLDPALVIPNYTQGQSLVESLWKSVRLPWGANFLGDPLAAPFTLQGTGVSTPVLTSVSPTSLLQGSSATVTLTGQNFTSPATVTWPATGGSVSNVTVVNATTVTATFAAAANATPGSYNVTVSTAAGTSGPVPFQITALAPAPVVTSISPTSGNPGTSVSVTLTGSNFAQGATVNLTGTGVSASSISVVSTTQLTATFTISATAATGTHNVTVTTSAGTSNAVAFTVNAAPAAPVLSSLSPASGTLGSTVNVTLTGTNFTPGATLAITGTGVSASSISVVSTTQITATFTIATTAATGIYNVTVTTAAGTSNTAAFPVNAAPAAPVLSSLSPASGTAGSTVNVALTGTGFTPGATLAITGTGVSASGISVVSATQITALFAITSTASTGARNVTITTAAGTSNTAAFTVNPATGSGPTLTALTPNNGLAGTSVNLTMTGTNFTPSTGVRLSGLGAAVRNLVVVSPTQITVTFVLSPTTAKGAHNVYVSNTAGNSAILPFTVN